MHAAPAIGSEGCRRVLWRHGRVPAVWTGARADLAVPRSDLGLVRCHGVCPLSACGVRGVALVTEAVPFTVEELAEAVLSTSTAASDAFLQSMAVQLANRVLYHHSRIT